MMEEKEMRKFDRIGKKMLDQHEEEMKMMEEKEMRKFDRIGDWQAFSKRMEEYLLVPIKKYSGRTLFNDFLFYTGLRIMSWNILKYALRIWLGAGKRNDFEKIAHYAQMAWTVKEEEGREAPFFDEDPKQEREFIRTAEKTFNFDEEDDFDGIGNDESAIILDDFEEKED